MNPTAIEAFGDELQKISARAGLKIIQRLMSKGTPEAMAQASRLAKTPGVLKSSPLGSQVKHLGRGGEGVADLVAHPEYGMTVRKLYDPTSAIASPTLISRKLQMAKQVKSPLLAETQGFTRTGRGGRVQFSEYVPGGAPTRKAESAIRSKLQGLGAKKGFQLEDIRKANIQGGKAIDVLPFAGGEASSMGAGNVLSMTPKGSQRFAQHSRKTFARKGGERGIYGVTKNPKTFSKKNLYRLLEGGGGTSKTLRQVKTAPTRASIKYPTPKTIPQAAPARFAQGPTAVF